MLGLTDIRKGTVIVHEGEPHLVNSAQFSRQQQRKPVVRSVLKNLKTGATREHTFQQSDQVEKAAIEHVSVQFLYKENDSFVFMNQKTFEQFELDSILVGEAQKFLLEGQVVDIMMSAGQAVSLVLPIKIDRKVIEAPPGIKGDTSTNVTKEVIVEGGQVIKAPLFIKADDVIRIDTRDGSYVERA